MAQIDEKNDINDLLLSESSNESNAKRYILAGSAFLILFFGVVGVMKILNSSDEEKRVEKNTTAPKEQAAPQMVQIPLENNETPTGALDKVMANAKNSQNNTTIPQPTSLVKEAMAPVTIESNDKTPPLPVTPKVIEKTAPSYESKPKTEIQKPSVAKSTPKPEIAKEVKPKTVVTNATKLLKVKSGNVTKPLKIEAKKEEAKTPIAIVGEYYVQVGSYSKEPPASFYGLIKSSGYNHKVREVDNNGTKIRKVIVGPFKSKEEANTELAKIRTNISGGAFVVK